MAGIRTKGGSKGRIREEERDGRNNEAKRNWGGRSPDMLMGGESNSSPQKNSHRNTSSHHQEPTGFPLGENTVK